MKKAYITSVIIASALFMGGCNSEDLSDLDADNSNDLELTISFVLPEYENACEADTRAMILEGGTINAVWAETDTVGIFPEVGDQLAYSMANGVGGTTAKFDGGSWAMNDRDTYTSYYPFNRWNFFKSASELELDYTGQTQIGINNADHLSAYDYLYAPKTKAANGSLTFNYSHIGFPMKITMTVPEVGSYESVYLKSNENLFVTKAELDLTAETPTLTPKTISKTHVLKLKNFTTTTANQKVVVFLMCYPINGKGKTFYINLRSTTGCVFTASVSPSANYDATMTRNLTKTMAYDTTESISFGGDFSTEESDL